MKKAHAILYYTFLEGRRVFCLAFTEHWAKFPDDVIDSFNGKKVKPMYMGFDLLGGTVEGDENVKESLVRELYEESCGTIKAPIIEDEITSSISGVEYTHFKVQIKNEDYLSSLHTFDSNRLKILTSSYSKEEKAPFLESRKIFWVEEDVFELFLEKLFGKDIELKAFKKFFKKN